MEEARRDWPALMDLGTAGDYLALKPASLLRLLGRENIQAVDVGAKLRRWRRRDLDDLIARLPPRGLRGSTAASDDKQDGNLDRALAAVERRAQRPRRQQEAR